MVSKMISGLVASLIALAMLPAMARPATASTSAVSTGAGTYLNSVACTSASACATVGNSGPDSSGFQQTFAEWWNGLAWSVVPSPNSLAAEANTLSGISCTSASACTAVGSHSNNGAGIYQTLIETWNGRAWSVVASPNPSVNFGNYLTGVSCVSTAACTAVGNYSTTGQDQTLIERWNGTAWSHVTSPNPGSTEDNSLSSISCTSANACTAVGSFGPSVSMDAQQTLVESWNGAGWTVVASPNPSDFDDTLSSISCVTSTACTAVGYYVTTPGSTPRQTLIEQWNGTAWSIVASPNVSATQANYLTGVSCTSASACTAVGSYDAVGGAQQTLIERWNGTTWSIGPSPDASTSEDNSLSGVSCTSVTVCTAVGDYTPSSGVQQRLIERWNGTVWSIVHSPSVSLSSASLTFAYQRVGTYGPLQTVTVTNNGDGTLNISNAQLATGNYFDFYGYNGCGHPVPPAQSCQISIGAAPARLGSRQTELQIFDNAGAIPQAVMLSVKGTEGYYLAGAAGEIANGGDATYYGEASGLHLSAPIVSITTTPNGNGYWLLGEDGGVFSYGNAVFHGSTGGLHLNKPVLGMTRTPDGAGYWLVASDGGIFAFGDAHFYGSTGGVHLNRPIVGMASTPDGKGYWLVASDGGIFGFGDAHFYGSTGAAHLAKPIVGMAATPTGQGYWLVASDGGIFNYGDAPFYGSLGGQGIDDVIGIAGTSPPLDAYRATHAVTVNGADSSPLPGTAYPAGRYAP